VDAAGGALTPHGEWVLVIEVDEFGHDNQMRAGRRSGKTAVVSVRPDPDQPERSSNHANEAGDAIWERGMGGPPRR